ncbi:hypothetical protein F5I97DRAFT_1937434 [Phlebopus sp. FC_14]|nr:hypothetical protein F5I97DRAFT_1937434 [Phlebopus sp. FC_14]
MLVPLTLPTCLFANGQLDPQTNVAELNLMEEPSARFTAWRLFHSSGPLGAAIGGEFGSVYLFGTPAPGEQTTIPNPENNLGTRSPTPTITLPSPHRSSSGPSSPRSPSRSRHSRPLTSPSSLSLNQALIGPSARSRVVSGVSREQVQAPTNFVYFDDESERLKDLLKHSALNRQPRERGHGDALFPNFERGAASERSPPIPPSPLLHSATLVSSGSVASKGREDPKSLLSATNSPLFTPKSLSTPPSPRPFGPPNEDLDDDAMSLIAHVLPARCGPGYGISDLTSPQGTELLVALQESGDLAVIGVHDGVCQASVQCENATCLTGNVWRWTRLRVVQTEERNHLVLACASSRPSNAPIFGPPYLADELPKKSACFTLLELTVGDPHGVHPTSLEMLGHWQVDGHAQGSDLVRNDVDGSLLFIYINNENHVISQPLAILAGFENHNAVTIPSPPKALGSSRSSENITVLPENTCEVPIVDASLYRLRFGQECDAGTIPFSSNQGPLSGLSIHCPIGLGKILGLAWTESEVLGFYLCIDGSRLSNSFLLLSEDTAKVWGVQLIDSETVAVLGHGGITCCQMMPMGIRIFRPRITHTITFGPFLALSSMNDTRELLVLRRTSTGCKEISVFKSFAPSPVPSRRTIRHKLWRTQQGIVPHQQNDAALSAVLPLELSCLILGYGDGLMRQTSFSTLVSSCRTTSPQLSFEKASNISVSSSIQTLHLIRNERAGDRFIIGGCDDGGLAIWSLDGLKLCARFTPFITPLIYVAQVRQQEENAGPLRGCALCVSADGTIVVIAVDGFELLYTIPGASSPLAHIYYGGGEDHNHVLLLYKANCARLWDVKTGEFRRSMDGEKAKEVLNGSGWNDIPIDVKNTRVSTSISTLSMGSVGVHSFCTFGVALERFIKFTAVDAKASSTEPLSSSPLSQLRGLLSLILTPGLSFDIDEICTTRLGVSLLFGRVGHSCGQSSALYWRLNPKSVWSISSTVSASRALTITAVLKTMSLYEELSDDCQTVIAFYATSLATAVGPFFKSPDLVYLCRQWFECSNELRQAARILFDAGVVRLSDEESIALVDAWQHHLPCLQPTVEKDSKQSALALFLCGYLAAEKYSLLSTSSLVDISKSIALYLLDDGSNYRALAIDLCARGFQIWQHYVDAMSMLRALCALATSTRKENISVQNVAPQARLSVLQVASSNTPLFMATLTLDILHPRNLEHRKSVMQLLVFLIRKKPLILYPNLPKLMEAVVKSLDPNSNSSRDAVLDTATEILGHVVKTFPTVDFHMGTQRLAVGTSEGAFIMYDLKTATQLYVLEGHKRRPTACSFSPDGRRLVTVSLEEGVVLVWKVGSSFTSLFNPGAPPRQGHSGSHPYKTLPFNVGDEANMTVAGTLEWVRFEWTSERSVRLHIRESTLTFSA